MTLAEDVVSAVILAISSQVSLQGWSRTSQAAATSARTDQQVRLLEQRLLASRRVLSSAPIADQACRWDRDAVDGVLEGLPEDAELSASWRFDATGHGLWLVVERTNPAAVIPFRRGQLLTPAGLGHCRREVTDAQ